MTAIKGATAVVTGAASGIGRALALELAARGCDLALADRDEAGLAALAAEIARDGKRRVTTHRIDVGAPAEIAEFARAATSAHPALNIVINNAGVALLGQFSEVDQAQMDWLFNINQKRRRCCGNQHQLPTPELALRWCGDANVFGVRGVSGSGWVRPSGRELTGAHRLARARIEHRW